MLYWFMEARTLRKVPLLLVSLVMLRGQVTPGTVPQRQTAVDCRQRTAEDFVPMSRTERTSYYVESLVGPSAILCTLVRSGVNQATDSPHEWEQNARGFGYRVASAYGQQAISVSFEEGIALGLDEDNRYFASGKHGFGPRLRYAIESSFLARHDNASRSFSYSAVGGPALGAVISRFWQPNSTRSAASAAASFGVTIGMEVGLNVAREFAPRFARRLLE
jgi:hypothetical protein